MRSLFRFLGAAAFCGLPLLALAQTTITAFSPTGTVKGVRQVTARFSGQMVPLGDMRLDDPFTVDCAEPGKGRWIDGSNWSYDFERDLPAGVACSFTVKQDAHDLAGQPVTGERRFGFDTGGPAVVEMLPYEGSQIDEQQIFVLGLDAPVSDATVAQHAWCRAEGIHEKIGVRILAGAEREQILAQRKAFAQRYLSLYFKARGVVWHAGMAVKDKRLERLPLVVLQCQRPLPAKAKVALVWGAGMATDNGIATRQDQALAFRTRPDFTAKFTCERLSPKAGCLPFLPTRVTFSAPVRRTDALAATLTGPGAKSFKPTVEKYQAKADYVDSISFAGPLPASSALRLALPAGLKDDAGRLLLNAARFPMTINTDAQPPLVKFPARFGIIEAQGDKLLPVTVRNVEAALAAQLATVDIDGASLRVNEGATDEQQDRQIVRWLGRMSYNGGWEPQELYHDQLFKPLLAGFEVKDGSADRVQRFTMPKPGGRQQFEVVGIPLKKPGFYVVELASPRLGEALSGKRRTAYVSSAALVTNLVAHFKRGAQSSLVWVTSLDQGQPVAGARVAVRDCAGKLLWQGATNKDGVANIAQQLAEPVCEAREGLFVSARHGADMTFTLSKWDRGIESWRFNLPTEYGGADNVVANTVFDRTLLRAGETVHMKHFLRRKVMHGFALEPSQSLPTSMFVIHEGSDQRYELPLAWRTNGSAANDWKIPPDARQGWYQVLVGGRAAGRFRVEQFRVPTMKALLQGPKAPAVQAAALDLDVQLSYLSGGGAGDAPVQLRTLVQDKPVSFDDYGDFSFSNGDVKVGVERSGGAFDEDEGVFDDGENEEGSGAVGGAVRTRNITLDKAGGARVTIDQLPAVTVPRELAAELSYQDANGETLSAATRVGLWPAAVVVGIAPDGWVLSRDALKFQVVVLDLQGKPVADAPVSVDFFQRESTSHRRRLVGGFYAYENSSEVKALGHACAGRTDAKGLLVCQVKAPAAGNLILRAQTQDAQQRVTTAHRETWVADGDDWWFNVSDNDRIDLLPEHKRYEPGQDASFQVRMPFRAATALVTVEREGVIDSYVRPLAGSAPVFTVPIKAGYAPNVYVSALVVRGRVAGVQPTALVDLGKPAYKLGIAPVRVGWAANELKVQVDPDQQVYKVRDKARVKVRVTRADGSAPPAGAEVALAAVDVGLLELMPNTSWNLLDAMMQQRSLQVQTATAQMQVVGKRHFGRKAVAAGGGGGKGGGRELFDTLLFWKAQVALDTDGTASVEVPLNDSLTAFRIVAIASAQAGLFGTGQAEVRSTQDLMLLSGLPALVREGDRLRAIYTVRNTTAAALDVALSARAGAQTLPTQKVALAAGQAKEIGWDYQVPAGVTALAWEVGATVANAGNGARDSIKVSQKVAPAVPVRTTQATLLQLDGKQSMAVRLPDDALPGRGEVQAQFSARLGGDLPGVRDFMRDYPYRCFEQVTSRAIALRDPALWRTAVATLPAHLDSNGLVKYFAPMLHGSDSLTAYVLSASQEAGYEIPAELKARMESGLQAFVQGKLWLESPLPTADLAVRKVAALEALSRSNAINHDDLESFTVAPNLWPTSAVIDWYLVLKRSPQLPQQARQLAQAEQILRARLNLQGTTMGFATERTDNWWWLMSSADSNANRLLLAMADNPAWRADMGRLARGTLGRQRAGHWDTTVSNAWGVLAMDRFSAVFERAPVTGSATAALSGASMSVSFGAVSVDASVGSNAGVGAGVRAGGKAGIAADPKAGPSTDLKSTTVALPWPKGSSTLDLVHAGTGKPWVTVRTLAALPLKAPVSSGYTIAKTITPVEQKTRGVWSRGDVYRVRLELEAQSDMTWVVVDDPIPASATVLGSGLGRDSALLDRGNRKSGWAWLAFEERSFDGYRAFYEFVPKGKWSVEYTVRLNNPGQFNLPPTRVEALYSPEMFGAAPNAQVVVK